MNALAATISYPTEGFKAPKDRTGGATGSLGLPAGTQVFSADDHISLSEDIFYEKFPEAMKDQAPRVIYDDGAWTLAVGGKTFLPREFNAVLMQYDPLAGSRTGDVDARLAELESDGIHRELAFPNALLGLMGWPDKDGPRAVLPHLQRAHRRGAGAFERPLLRRRHDQLVGRRRLPPHARRAEGARPQDVLAAAQARRRRRRQADRLQQPGDVPRVGGDRGERPPRRRTTSARPRWRRRAATTA